MKKLFLVALATFSIGQLQCAEPRAKDFFDAIERLDTHKVRECIAAGVDVGAHDEYGFTALTSAVSPAVLLAPRGSGIPTGSSEDQHEIIKMLLASMTPEQVGARSQVGENALMIWTAGKLNKESFRLIISVFSTEDLNAQSQKGHTILTKMLICGNASKVDDLIAAGADFRLGPEDYDYKLVPAIKAVADTQRDASRIMCARELGIKPRKRQSKVSNHANHAASRETTSGLLKNLP